MRSDEQLKLGLGAETCRGEFETKSGDPDSRLEQHSVRRLIPVPQFNKYHPDPSPAAIRWMIFTNKDGFNRCVLRRGRRVLIDEAEYFRWLDSLNGR